MSLVKRIGTYHSSTPEWLKDIKFKALRENPFRFFRGTNHLFAEDLNKRYPLKSKVRTWMCGDMHFENFGSYKGEDRQIYFDITDFDDAMLATPEIDVTRFIASVMVAASDMNVSIVKLHKVVHDIMEVYINALTSRKTLVPDVNNTKGDLRKFFAEMSSVDRELFVEKRTEKIKGSLYIKTNGENYIDIDENEKIEIFDSLTPLLNRNPRFADFVFEDAAIRISGTGSLGLNRYCVLLFSRRKGKRYLLDIKEARRSCYEGWIHVKQPPSKNEAERILQAAYIMPYLRPAFVATVKMNSKYYLVKELQPSMDRIRHSDFNNDLSSLLNVANQLIALLAYSQLRSSGHFGASPADDLVKYVTKKQWQKDIIDLAATLAEKNNKYYNIFVKQ